MKHYILLNSHQVFVSFEWKKFVMALTCKQCSSYPPPTILECFHILLWKKNPVNFWSPFTRHLVLSIFMLRQEHGDGLFPVHLRDFKSFSPSYFSYTMFCSKGGRHACSNAIFSGFCDPVIQGDVLIPKTIQMTLSCQEWGVDWQ